MADLVCIISISKKLASKVLHYNVFWADLTVNQNQNGFVALGWWNQNESATQSAVYYPNVTC